jgi:hypothetical protein
VKISEPVKRSGFYTLSSTNQASIIFERCPNEEAARVHLPITTGKLRPRKVAGKLALMKLMILIYA